MKFEGGGSGGVLFFISTVGGFYAASKEKPPEFGRWILQGTLPCNPWYRVSIIHLTGTKLC